MLRGHIDGPDGFLPLPFLRDGSQQVEQCLPSGKWLSARYVYILIDNNALVWIAMLVGKRNECCGLRLRCLRSCAWCDSRVNRGSPAVGYGVVGVVLLGHVVCSLVTVK